MPEQPEFKIVAHATEPECQEMQSFLDELSTWNLMLKESINEVVSGQVILRKKMREYWKKIRLVYKLNPDFNYNINHLTGDIYATGLAVKPDAPEKPEKPK